MNEQLLLQSPTSSLKAGQWVRVRTKEEILGTLDVHGQLEGMPFMPEMFAYCGQPFQVYKRAHKTCDTVNKTGGRRVPGAVHLENVRCNGVSHGGCQAACLIFWKDAWLQPLDGSGEAGPVRHDTDAHRTEADVERATRAGGKDEIYSCQATLLPAATTLLSKSDPRQYWEDWRSGNASAVHIAKTASFAIMHWFANLGVGLGRPFRRLYDGYGRMTGGHPYPFYRGRIAPGRQTPSRPLGLQPGERVRVRGFEDILQTLDEHNKNRGLYFDCEEVPHCGKEYTVRSRVNRIIDEKTGKMNVFKSESIILEDAVCGSRYSDRRLFCPRAIFPMWKEIWLERVESAPKDGPATKA